MNLIHLADQVDLYDKLPDGWLSGSVPDGWLSGSVKRPHHVCLTIWGTLRLNHDCARARIHPTIRPSGGISV
ncbi:hypothetical protein WUBG_05946 [Wuchereria bancrofti]|uniref:Uncharacterized protein n=1 Tax=Wuchereria bancrofti TaxID=6293 RepID=J9F113_WUCBA|nr:hypothetical protein WUBG_05946 [Wuchereria bancrofti]